MSTTASQAARAAAEGRAFLTALQFLSRLPVPDPGWAPGQMRRAAAWFPAIGLLLGALGGGVYWLASAVLPGAVAAGLALGALVLLSGALHEDGLADLADATGNPGTAPERALEILRDSRIGSFGAVALLLAMGLRWSALAALAPAAGFAALALAGLAGRAAILPVAAALRPAREGGLGASLAEGSPGGRGTLPADRRLALALAGSGALLLLAGGLGGLVAAALAGLAALVLARHAARRLGGVTGDVFGAVALTAETAALIGFAALWAEAAA